MKTDSDLLENSINKQLNYPVFRLYGWEPACISLGRNQNDEFLDKDFLQQQHIDIVKRLTGGRALLHADEITYSYICPINYLKNGEHIISSYKEICQILIDKFKILGIELDFGTKKQIKTGFEYCMLVSTGADLCYKGKKLIGSAQYRKHGYILQHGSILYNYDAKLLEKIFKEPINTSEITTIKEINPHITKEDIIKIFSEP
ncbi:lipoate--protein ligase family protein [bacterium]|nr:lipoate--protein ligase family protein [bacterium]